MAANVVTNEMRIQFAKVSREKRIRKFLNSLAVAPKRVCRTLHHCELCACDIKDGEEYRDRGVDRRAHEFCFQAVAREFKEVR